MTSTCFGLLGCLFLSLVANVNGQVTIEVAACGDLPSSVSEDTIITFTAIEVLCSASTSVAVDEGVSVEITSAQDASKIENVRFQLAEKAEFVSSVPALEWASGQVASLLVPGSALLVGVDSKATFKEDVTFQGIYSDDYPDNPGELSDDEYTNGTKGGPIENYGTLVFEKTATFADNTDNAALYNQGKLTFEGDAVFENNTNLAGIYRFDGGSLTNLGGSGNGAGLYNEGGSVEFVAAASFLGNVVSEYRSFESEGIWYSDGMGAGVYTINGDVLFSGPASFKGNKGRVGVAITVFDSDPVIFESLVTFEDNVGESVGDASKGGAMMVDDGNVEIQGGVTATGNIAHSGGVFYLEEGSNLTVSGPVSMTGNEARYQGGAIYSVAEKLVLPSDADISGNTAIMCPGIKNGDGDSQTPFDTYRQPGSLEFSEGSTTIGGSRELCYLGQADGNGGGPESHVLGASSDCAGISAAAPTFGGYPYISVDSSVVSTWTLPDLFCDTQLIVHVSGGEELTVKASAATTSLSNVRFEVVGYTKLTLVGTEITMTGIARSAIGGTVFVDRGSSMDVMSRIYFKDNTLRYLSDSAWVERGGASLYSSGDVKFYENAYFLGNGQFEADGFEVWNEPGGAILSIGTLEFMKKAVFDHNFALNGGNGGGVCNGGNVTFNRRAMFRNNTVENSFTDDGEPYNGHGGAFYNFGPSATAFFKRLAFFKDNVGGTRGCAVAVNGDTEDPEDSDSLNSVVFEDEAKFKDNVCTGGISRNNDTGGAGLWVYGGATVEFQDRAVFKRHTAYNGAAIMNAGTIIFSSDDLMQMTDNVGLETCPDIKNYDKDLGDHEYYTFGDINDPDGICSCCGSLSNRLCTWYEGTIRIGTESYTGESVDICERPL